MLCIRMNLILLLLSTYISSIFSANILGIFLFQAPSHYRFAKPLMVALAKRGHHVTVYTPFPDRELQLRTSNYLEVDTSMCMRRRFTAETWNIEYLRSARSQTARTMFTFPMSGAQTIQDFEECNPLLELLNSTTKYDLLMTEAFKSDGPLMFASKFGIPFISITPNALTPFLASRVANVANPSYIAVLGVTQGYIPPMNFLQRVVNTIAYSLSIILYHQVAMKKENAVIQHFLGSSAPSLYDIVKNTSLVISNSDVNLNGAIPTVPNVIQVLGMHIDDTRPLPRDIEKFINESTDGVVYFSMGSRAHGSSFPEEKREAFLHAFARLPQRVLWKWEEEALPGKSDNIMISKWMPQRDILAHPNIKLFISHGGLLGMTEAVYEGVPMLGIPIFGDQRTNLKNIEAKGAGEILDYEEITEAVVFEKVSRLVNNPEYKKNAMDLSIKFKDRPMSPLDTAIYWTEYVIRHKGAHHLKTAAVDMPWYQYLLLDVIAFLFFVLISTLAVLHYTLRTMYRYFRPLQKVKTN